MQITCSYVTIAVSMNYKRFAHVLFIIPSPVCCAFISQIIRHTRICFTHENIIIRAPCHSNKLRKQGYVMKGRGGLVVNTLAYHTGDPGSISGRGGSSEKCESI